MFDQQSIYDNCCLLNGVRLDAERVESILQRRFRSNNHQTSFDFKSIRPEKPSINAKVSRSLLRFNPGVVTRIRDENELISSSESSSSSEDEIETENEKLSKTDDEYLNELAEWEPDRFLTILSDDDDDESMISENETSPNNNISEETRIPTGYSFRFLLDSSTEVRFLFRKNNGKYWRWTSCNLRISTCQRWTDSRLHGRWRWERVWDSTARRANRFLTERLSF